MAFTTGGNGIKSVYLESPKSNKIFLYSGKENSTISHISKVSNDVLLFDECSYPEGCFIKKLEINTKQTKSLNLGRLPSYVPSHKKYFFYNSFPNGENWLSMASLDDFENAIKIAKEPKPKKLPNGINLPLAVPVIQISTDEIIFVGEDEGLWSYNIRNKNLQSLNIYNCRPILWREKTKQLLCFDQQWDTFLLKISDQEKVELQKLKETYGHVYLPFSDSLIYGRTKSNFLFGESYDIYLFSFQNEKEKKILKNSHIANGVWTEN